VSHGLLSISGSLAKLAAMRRASSRVSRLAAERRPGSSSKWEVGGCLSDALAVPIPPMARLKQKKTIGAHIAPARALASTGKCKRVIFAFVVDT
jgi:hypothetical protein